MLVNMRGNANHLSPVVRQSRQYLTLRLNEVVTIGMYDDAFVDGSEVLVEKPNGRGVEVFVVADLGHEVTRNRLKSISCHFLLSQNRYLRRHGWIFFL